MSCRCRWAQFRQSIEQVEDNVRNLQSGEVVSYRESIGGGYYVSITSGFACIDVRKFFIYLQARPTSNQLDKESHYAYENGVR